MSITTKPLRNPGWCKGVTINKNGCRVWFCDNIWGFMSFKGVNEWNVETEQGYHTTCEHYIICVLTLHAAQTTCIIKFRILPPWLNFCMICYKSFQLTIVKINSCYLPSIFVMHILHRLFYKIHIFDHSGVKLHKPTFKLNFTPLQNYYAYVM
jgi:hypothetical protein